MLLEVYWEGFCTLLLGSHNFMVMALGSCVKWPSFEWFLGQISNGVSIQAMLKFLLMIISSVCIGEALGHVPCISRAIISVRAKTIKTQNSINH